MEEIDVNTTLPRRQWSHFIGGRWVPADDGTTIPIENPSTATEIAEVARAGQVDVDAAVAAARAAYESRVLVDMRPSERAALMFSVAKVFDDLADEIALVDCLENGKPLQVAKNEPAAGRRYFTYYGGMVDKFEGVSIPLGDGYVDYTTRVPFGVSAQIVPWNFPFQVAARCVACAIATGNTVVLKTPELSPLSCTYIAEACERAGVPDGVVNILCGYGNEAGEALISHRDVNHIVFTGSVATGHRILHAAAERIVPCVMELGGKSAAIVYEDADLDQVETSMTGAIFTHAGQVCSAASRLVVHENVRDEVVDRLVQRAEALTVGPAITGPDLGPVISSHQRDRVLGYVDRAREKGATVLTGGSPAADLEGHYVEPTIVDGATPEAEIVQEEVFGPVLAVQSFTEPDEAVALANGTPYGLCAGVHTTDLRLAHWTAERMEAGQVFVNEWFAGGAETPFGGMKQSGYGREKGQEALLNYVQTRNVAIRLDGHGAGRPGG